MTTARRPPSDRDVELMLRARAGSPDPMLLQDILAATDASTPRRTWFRAGLIRWRPTSLFAAAMLATLLIGGALSLGSDPFSPDPTPDPSQHIRVHFVDEGDELEAGVTYWVDPDYDHVTPLRVDFMVPTAGWLPWTGTYKDIDDEGGGPPRERISINIVEITNLTVDACNDKSFRTPAVGPSVDDLAEALLDLPPFEVVSPAADVSAYGYRGKHLVLRIPDDMVANDGLFEDCTGTIRAWTSQIFDGTAYYGYVRPGDTEEYWILDVEGTRLVISVLTAAGTSSQLVAEGQAVLDSIEIVP